MHVGVLCVAFMHVPSYGQSSMRVRGIFLTASLPWKLPMGLSRNNGHPLVTGNLNRRTHTLIRTHRVPGEARCSPSVRIHSALGRFPHCRHTLRQLTSCDVQYVSATLRNTTWVHDEREGGPSLGRQGLAHAGCTGEELDDTMHDLVGANTPTSSGVIETVSNLDVWCDTHHAETVQNCSISLEHEEADTLVRGSLAVMANVRCANQFRHRLSRVFAALLLLTAKHQNTWHAYPHMGLMA